MSVENDGFNNKRLKNTKKKIETQRNDVREGRVGTMACLPTQRRGRNVEESNAVNNAGATYSRDSHSISGRHLGAGKEAGSRVKAAG